MCYFVYIIRSAATDSYYRGQTKDLTDRINRHNSGYEKATRDGIPWELVWSTKKSSRSEAMILERKLKNLSRDRLINFIEKNRTQVAGPDAAL